MTIILLFVTCNSSYSLIKDINSGNPLFYFQKRTAQSAPVRLWQIVKFYLIYRKYIFLIPFNCADESKKKKGIYKYIHIEITQFSISAPAFRWRERGRGCMFIVNFEYKNTSWRTWICIGFHKKSIIQISKCEYKVWKSWLQKSFHLTLHDLHFTALQYFKIIKTHNIFI